MDFKKQAKVLDEVWALTPGSSAPNQGKDTTMSEFTYTVCVEAATKEQADQVIAERIHFDEDYGFEYTLWVQDAP